MKQIDLSAGTIEYSDTGGNGPVVVLLHGLMMDASLWDQTAAGLASSYRCLAPTLPLGSHRQAMTPGADLSLSGIAGMVGEFLERMDLRDVTLAGNDTGGALVQLLIREQVPRVARVVLVSCDAFDNFPPGLTGKALVTAGKLPPAMFGLFMQQMRLRPMRRSPAAYGWLTKRGDTATVRCLQPVLTRPEIRQDTVRVLRAAAADKHVGGSESARHFMQTRDPSGLPEPLDPEHLARAYCSLLRDRDRFEETIGMPDADLAGIRERAQRGRACRGMNHRAVASGERGHDGRRGQQRH